MEKRIANSLQLRRLQFVAGSGDKLTQPSPTPLPFDLQEWWNQLYRIVLGLLIIGLFLDFFAARSPG